MAQNSSVHIAKTDTQQGRGPGSSKQTNSERRDTKSTTRPMTQNQLRRKKRGQSRRVPLDSKCKSCGSTEKLERHHERYDQPPEVFLTLCQSCHISLHMQRDGWGRPQPKPAICLACKKQFQPKRSRNSKCCSNSCSARWRFMKNGH